MKNTKQQQKRTAHVATNIITYIIIESVVQVFYFIKQPSGFLNLITSVGSDLLMVALAFYIGNICVSLNKWIAVKLYDTAAGKFYQHNRAIRLLIIKQLRKKIQRRWIYQKGGRKGK